MRYMIVVILSFLFCLPVSSAEESREVDVIIVGGGLSGLSAAYKLKQAGVSFQLLELKPRLGGRVQTLSVEGFNVEVGLAEFWSENPAMEMINHFEIKTDQSVAFSSALIDGKVYPYIEDSNKEYLEKLLGPEEYKKFVAWNQSMEKLYQQTLTRPISAELMKLKDISFRDWVVKNSGLAEKTSEFIRLTISVETGTGWEQFSALDGIDEWSLFHGDGQIPNEIVGGNHQLIDALASFAGSQNIETNRQVKNIRQTKASVEVTALDTTSYESRNYTAKYVISTVPLYRLLFDIGFEPPLPLTVQQAIQTQTWGSYCTVLVVLEPGAQKYWMIDGVSELPILTDSPLGVVYEGNPSAGEHEVKILSLLTTGPFAERYNLQPQDQTEAEVRTSLEQLWPGSSKMIRRIELFRQHPRAIAAWPVGRSRFDELSEAIRKPHGRVYLAGDFTENSHSSGAVISGFRTAKEIIENIKSKNK